MSAENHDKDDYKLISLLATYIYLKDRYPNLQIDLSRKNYEIEEITKELKKLDEYAHLPNKVSYIKDSYDNIASRCAEKDFDEELFLDEIKGLVTKIDAKKRKYLLDCLINIASQDNSISINEKETILQVARVLGVNKNFDTILKDKNKSQDNKNTILVSAISIGLLFAVIGSGAFMLIGASTNQKIFRERDIVFSEVFFNRFVIYQNKFKIGSDYLRKQAVFFLNGTAEVSFAAEQLSYIPEQKKVILSYSEITPFSLKFHWEEPLTVDQIDPQPISEDTAKKIGATVGVVSGIAGGALGISAGQMLGKLIPAPYNLVASAAGGIGLGLVSGASGYFLTSDALSNLQIIDKLSPSERREVTESGKILIEGTLEAESELMGLYKEKFDAYIRAKYSQHNLDVNLVEYKKVNNGGA